MAYKSINRLSRNIQELSELLDSGEISSNQLDSLIESSSELHERCLILRYKIQEQKQKTVEKKKKPKSKVVEEIPVLFKVEPIQNSEFSPNQTSLIDVIEEIEEEQKPLEIQSAMFDIPSIPETDKKEKPKKKSKAKSNVDVLKEIEKIEDIAQEIPVELKVPDVVEDFKEEIKKKSTAKKEIKTADKKEALVDKMKSAPISDLASSINLNLKFRFIKNLFSNEGDSYKSSIEEMNNAASLGAAMDLLEVVKTTNDWEEEIEEEVLLIELLERKFS